MKNLTKSSCPGILLLVLFPLVSIFLSTSGQAAGSEVVMVAQENHAMQPLNSPRQIFRTSSGKIHYVFGSGGHTTMWDGWISIYSSEAGKIWRLLSTHDEWYGHSGIGVAVDSRDIMHMITFDWSGRPYYEKFNTEDSVKRDNSWEDHELIEDRKAGNEYSRCSIALDSNDVPHVLYKVFEKYKGKNHLTLWYANRVGGVWHRTVLWPKENSEGFYGSMDIAIGPDDVPYVLMGSTILRGNANNPTAFEVKDVGDAYSFVIHKNGDVRVALADNGYYANFVHDNTQPWDTGWTLQDSGNPDGRGILVLSNDNPYLVQLINGDLWTQKGFEAPVLVASEPGGYTWQSFSTRWRFYNYYDAGLIDIGIMSWDMACDTICFGGNAYWYASVVDATHAFFEASPSKGLGPLTVNFRDLSEAPSGLSIVSWAWDFNNDEIIDSTMQNPTVTYSDAGKYAVSLTVSDSDNDSGHVTRKDYISVETDLDSDGIYDSEDDCPSAYDPRQIDLDKDGTGDVCDDNIDLIGEAVFAAGLKKETRDEGAQEDVTAIMKDGLIDNVVMLQKGKRGYDILSLRSNVESEQLVHLEMSLYVSGLEGGNPQVAHIYAYNGDGVSVQSSSFLTINVESGWNSVDLDSILHSMDGMGFVKFRIVVPQNWVDISEARIGAKTTGGVDDLNIAVNPSALNFGATEAGGYSGFDLEVSNTGTGDLVIGDIMRPSPPFYVGSDKCSGQILKVSQGCTITVGFAPGAEGLFSDSLKIPSNDHDNLLMPVALTGDARAQATLTGVVTDANTGLHLSDVTVTVTVPKDIDLAPGDLDYTSSQVDTSSYPPGDGDLSTSFTSDDYDAVLFNDGNKARCLGSHRGTFGSYQVCESRFKVRNPLNEAEPFRVTWNGLGGYQGNELMGQSLMFSRNGTLTMVSIPLTVLKPVPFLDTVSDRSSGDFKIFLKSVLGGEKDAVLATSDPVLLSAVPVGVSSWIDFNFPGAPELIAGESYYLELDTNGCYWGDLACYTPQIHWSYESPNPYASGSGFMRSGGLWASSIDGVPDWSFAFKVYLDGEIDQQQTSETQGSLTMSGIENAYVALDLLDREADIWSNAGGGYQEEGYDDLTFERVYDGDTAKYYDEDGWLSFRADVRSLNPPVLATDLFNVEFLDRRTVTTDTSGAFVISGLPGRDYSVTFDSPGYEKLALTGTLISGQIQDVNVQLTPLAPATLTGTVKSSDGQPLVNAVVTITDVLKTQTALTDSNGNYTISGITPGTFTATFEKEGYIKKTNSGTAAAGQVQTLSIQLEPMPSPVLAITSPQDGAVVNSSLITVTGDANNNAQVTVNGIQASMSGSAFSVSIPIIGGINTITANSTDEYGQTTSKTISVTMVASPAISGIQVSSVESNSATIKWTTDQLSDSIVEYGTTASYGELAHDASMVTNHSVTLSNLTLGTTYHFIVKSTNDYGFSSLSADNIFTTSKFQATFLGDYGNVSVMAVTGNYDAKNPDGSLNRLARQEIAKQYVKNHTDDYDFMIIFSNFDFAMPDSGARAFYLEVSNDVQGIGKAIFDGSSSYGSNGRLQGIIDIGDIVNRFSGPEDPRFEDTLNDIAHEQMHRWGAAVKFKDSQGNISSALIGKDGEHWSYLLDSDASVLYGNDWQDNGDGTFTSTGKEHYYSALDLYLAGFYDKSQVPAIVLIDNPSIDPAKLPEVGATIPGTAKYVTIDDIIGAEGERVPDASSAQKTFKTAFILITRPDTFTGDEIPAIESLRSAWAGRFAQLTDGKGSIMADVAPDIATTISSPADGETITGPDVTVKGMIINSTGNETGITVNGMVANVYGNQFIANHVPLVEGPNTITVTALDTAGTTATTSITANAIAGDYIRLIPNIESGISPLEVSLRINGSFSIDNSNISAEGPEAIELLDNPTPDEYRIKMTAEGTYYITANVTGPDGNTYHDTLPITVLNKEQLDRFLKSKWEAMRTALATGDIEAVVTYIGAETKQHYFELFTALQPYLPEAVHELSEIRLVRIYDKSARYRMSREELYGGQIVTLDYAVYFVVDGNGLWKIDWF